MRRRPTGATRGLDAQTRAFGRNRTALAGLVMFGAIALAALGAPLLAGVDPIDQDMCTG